MFTLVFIDGPLLAQEVETADMPNPELLVGLGDDVDPSVRTVRTLTARKHGERYILRVRDGDRLLYGHVPTVAGDRPPLSPADAAAADRLEL